MKKNSSKKITIILLTVIISLFGATSVLADSQTQIISPVKGGIYNNPLSAIIWNQTTDVTVAQVSITAIGTSWSYNSGAIFMSPTTLYVHNLPPEVIASMPTGLFSVYVENYHYTGGVYTGFSSDQAFFSVTN